MRQLLRRADTQQQLKRTTPVACLESTKNKFRYIKRVFQKKSIEIFQRKKLNFLCKIVNRSDEKYSLKKCFKAWCLRVQTGMVSDRRHTTVKQIRKWGKCDSFTEEEKSKERKKVRTERKKQISYERVTLTKVH